MTGGSDAVETTNLSCAKCGKPSNLQCPKCVELKLPREGAAFWCEFCWMKTSYAITALKILAKCFKYAGEICGCNGK